jgi:hypothetical protein
MEPIKGKTRLKSDQKILIKHSGQYRLVTPEHVRATGQPLQNFILNYLE